MGGANEISRMDAVKLAKSIRAKELSPSEVIEAVLTRMEAWSRTSTPFARQHPIWRAEKPSASRRPSWPGGEVGPLAGVPVGIKDLICTEGMRTVSGSFAYEDFVPDEDDVVVERIKHAGAIIDWQDQCTGVRV